MVYLPDQQIMKLGPGQPITKLDYGSITQSTNQSFEHDTSTQLTIHG
jgi:hypothetical protein